MMSSDNEYTSSGERPQVNPSDDRNNESPGSSVVVISPTTFNTGIGSFACTGGPLAMQTHQVINAGAGNIGYGERPLVIFNPPSASLNMATSFGNYGTSGGQLLVVPTQNSNTSVINYNYGGGSLLLINTPNQNTSFASIAYQGGLPHFDVFSNLATGVGNNVGASLLMTNPQNVNTGSYNVTPTSMQRPKSNNNTDKIESTVTDIESELMELLRTDNTSAEDVANALPSWDSIENIFSSTENADCGRYLESSRIEMVENNSGIGNLSFGNMQSTENNDLDLANIPFEEVPVEKSNEINICNRNENIRYEVDPLLITIPNNFLAGVEYPTGACAPLLVVHSGNENTNSFDIMQCLRVPLNTENMDSPDSEDGLFENIFEEDILYAKFQNDFERLLTFPDDIEYEIKREAAEIGFIYINCRKIVCIYCRFVTTACTLEYIKCLHEKKCPYCYMVSNLRNIMTSKLENLKVIQSYHDNRDPKIEAHRLIVFIENSRPLEKNEIFKAGAFELAESGYVIIKDLNGAQCFYCRNVFYGFEDLIDLKKMHLKCKPKCDSLRRKPKQINIVRGQELSYLFPNNIIEYKSFIFVPGGIHPLFGLKDSRLQTFYNWKYPLLQNKDDLSTAGFFYYGQDDKVKCYHCGGRLRNWNICDNPWVQHAMWYPECEYVAVNKGHTFIEKCKTISEYNQTTQRYSDISHASPVNLDDFDDEEYAITITLGKFGKFCPPPEESST